MNDRLRDVINYFVSSIDAGEINVYDEIVIKRTKIRKRLKSKNYYANFF